MGVGQDRLRMIVRKTALIDYMQEKTGITLRGLDAKIARGQISFIWKLGFDDDNIRDCIDWAIKYWGGSLTFSLIYRKIESWENKLVYEHGKKKL